MKRLIISFLFVYSVCLSAYAQGNAASDGKKKFDKSNLVTKEWITDISTDVRYLDHVTAYGPDGRKVEEVEYGDQSVKWRKKFEYAPDGRLSRVLTYDSRDRLDNVRTYEYDELGRKSREQVYNAKAKLVKVKIYEYSVSE